MKIAAIQFCPEFKRPHENLTRLVYLVQKAATAGAKVVVLPELATTGYSFMSRAEAEPFAEVLTASGPLRQDQSMSVMRLLAKRWKVGIVWGLIEKDPLTKKLYNSQVYIDPSGYFTSYRKVNRFGNDYLWSISGEGNPPVVRTELEGREWKIGLLICRDVRDKRGNEETSFYEPGDADFVCFSANWGDGGFPANAWMDFVESNRTCLVVANRYGREVPNNFGEGGSCIIYPNGEVSCEGLVWNEDCIVMGDLK